MGKEPFQRFAQAVRVRGTDKAGFSVLHEMGRFAGIAARHDGLAAGERFERYVAVVFPQRHERYGQRAGIVHEQFLIADVPGQSDARIACGPAPQVCLRFAGAGDDETQRHR